MDLRAAQGQTSERSFTGGQAARVVRAHGALAQAASVFALLAALSLGVMVLLIPLRANLLHVDRNLPPLYYAYRNLVLYPADVPALAALVFWALSLACRPRPIRVRPLALTLPISALTLASLASIPASPDRIFSAYQGVRLVLLFALYLYILNELSSLRFVFFGAAAQIAIQSAVGIAQVLRQHSLGLTRLQELALDPAKGGISIVVSGAVRSLRAYGLTDHPNILGGCLALALLLVLVWHFQIDAPWKPLTTALILLGGAAILLTFSRSAWLGLAVGLALLIIWLAAARRWENVNQALILGAACLLLLMPFLLHNAGLIGIRLGQNGSFLGATPENQAINERGLLTRIGLAIFSAHPLTGVGVGAFPQALHIVSPSYPFDLQPPHLVALDVAAETGALGGVAYLAAAILPWVYLFWRRKSLRFTLELAGVSAALLAISVISWFDYYPWMAVPGQLWQWSLWGAWASQVAVAKGESAHD